MLAMLPAQVAERAGTAIVRGRVVADDTGAPLRDASVTLMPLKGATRESAVTDANGAFEFASLVPGDYRLRAQPGPAFGRYLPLDDSQGSSADLPLVRAAANRVLEGVEIRLQPGGVVAGRVVDDYGDPVAAVNIHVVQKLAGGRLQRAGRPREAATNDRGQFRVFGLRPGRYLVCAHPRVTAPAVQSEGASRLLATCHPAAPQIAEAVPVSVGAGEEATGLEVRLVRARLLTVRGAVVDSRGSPSPNSIVSLMNRLADGGFASRDAAMEPDGSFVLRSVVPGDYFLTVRPPLDPRDADPSSESAVVPIAVHRDLDGVVLATKPLPSIAGRMVVDEAAPPPLPAALRVVAEDAEGRPVARLFPSTALVAADGTFTLHAVPDQALLRVAGAAGWWLESVTLGGMDVTDVPTDYGHGETRVEIVLSRQGASITGSVTTDEGKPAPNAWVVLLGADRTRWTSRASTTRIVRSSIGGSFTIPALRPGRHVIVAVRSDEAVPQHAGVEYFEMLAGVGEPLTLDENETRWLPLRLSRLPE